MVRTRATNVGRAWVAILLVLLALTPFSSTAQPKRVPKIGVLWPNPPATFDFIRQGLTELGYVEGRNIAFEYRWAQDKLGQLPELAAELVQLKVDLIITLAPQATIAAKNATQTIPIVFVAMGDPVASGVIATLARPGGNVTGTTRMISEMSGKHVEFLKQAVPGLSRLAILWNPLNSSHVPALETATAVAHSLAIRVQALEVREAADLDGVFAAMARERADGVLFIADPVFFIHLRRMAELIAAARLPAVCNFTEFPKMGGLIGYAPSLPDEFRRVATHIDKILKGAKPGELPVQQPGDFELVINLKTAKALGLAIPPSVLLRANQVIE